MNPTAMNWIADNQDELIALSDEIYAYGEPAQKEYKSVKALGAYLTGKGFEVEYGVGGVETAFRAVWGQGKPVIGFLGEYDALPGLMQKPVPYCDCDTTQWGHGCAHNLLGVGTVAAALGLKAHLESTSKSGTVVYYGCPAEETLQGKAFMAAGGCFKELDCALTWHPNVLNRAGVASNQAIDIMSVEFHGKTAHAANTPHLGRSALDACELMNVGVNYLREHVTDDVRIHYSYTNGGGAANVVPEYASLSYFVRGIDRAKVSDTTERVLRVAAGAAMMTDTTTNHMFKARTYDGNMNFVISRLAEQHMLRISPEFDQADYDFADRIIKELGNDPSKSTLDAPQVMIKDEVIHVMGSTDVSDVSHIVPTMNIHVITAPSLFPLHHWAFAACASSGIGHKGMIRAGKVIAQTAVDLVENPALLTQAWAEFEQTNTPWTPLF